MLYNNIFLLQHSSMTYILLSHIFHLQLHSPDLDRVDADTPVPYILGAYLIQLGLVGILVDRLVEGQPQLVAAQRFHPGDLRLGQLVLPIYIPGLFLTASRPSST